MGYTSDLTKPQFELFEKVLPHSKTYKNVISRHLIVNAILYQLKNGCQWRDLPIDYPNWQTVYSQCAEVENGWKVGKGVGGIGEE